MTRDSANLPAPLAAAACLLPMTALLLVIGAALFGSTGLLIALGVGVVVAVAALPPESATRNMLRMGAIPLDHRRAPRLSWQVAELAQRAGVPRPALFLLPSRQPNALTMGVRGRAALGVTDTLLTTLSEREVRGVVAHEIAHIQQNDVWLAGLAGTVRRFTGGLALFGIVGLLFALPAMLLGVVQVPVWVVVVVLLVAPTLSGVLQMALARSREFNADRVAAGLSGDPEGLASALVKLERQARTLLEQVFGFGYRAAQTLARITDSHPPAAERVARLLELAGQRPRPFAGQHSARIRTIPVRVG